MLGWTTELKLFVVPHSLTRVRNFLQSSNGSEKQVITGNLKKERYIEHHCHMGKKWNKVPNYELTSVSLMPSLHLSDIKSRADTREHQKYPRSLRQRRCAAASSCLPCSYLCLWYHPPAFVLSLTVTALSLDPHPRRLPAVVIVSYLCSWAVRGSAVGGFLHISFEKMWYTGENSNQCYFFQWYFYSDFNWDTETHFSTLSQHWHV